MLLNLFSNSLKFTDRNGKITVVIEKQQTQLRISVIDNGLGIKEEDKTKLFKLFGSIKTETVNKNGIGLGLVICQKIVAKFDGIIDFISEYQKGTTFFFTFEI